MNRIKADTGICGKYLTAFFMVPPAKDEGYNLSVDSNGFEGFLTAHATGIVACLFAYYYMWEMTDDDRFVQLYHSLRAYALTLDERKQYTAQLINSTSLAVLWPLMGPFYLLIS